MKNKFNLYNPIGLLTKYNTQNSLIIISDFPQKNEIHGNNVSALGFFSKKTAMHLNSLSKKKHNRLKIIVLANILSKEEICEQNGILVIRCFKRNNLLSFSRVFYYLQQLSRIKNCLVEFEFGTYGNTKLVMFTPLFLFVMKLTGRKTYFVLHQVIVDLKKLSDQLGLSIKSLFLKFLEKGIKAFYFLIGLLSYKIIVLETEFKKRLTPLISEKKITVIPIGVNKHFPSLNHSLHKNHNAISDFNILSFGYISWYKGTDQLIRLINDLPKNIGGKNIKLVIAGGKSFSQKGNDHYNRYFHRIQLLAKKNKNINITGFVPESEISTYFASADLCIFPYREFISSSGPLSLAFAHRKPIILSNKLKAYMYSNDFKQSMKKARITSEDLFINMNKIDLKECLIKAVKDKTYLSKLSEFSHILGIKRSWNHVINSYYQLIHNNMQYKKASYHLTLPLLSKISQNIAISKMNLIGGENI